MLRFERILLGYFILNIDAKDISRAADIFLKANESVALNNGEKIIIPFRDKEKICNLLNGKIRYQISDVKGVFGFFIKNKKRFGLFLALFLGAILLLLSSDTVWDVRIEGASEDKEAQIVLELSEAGLSVGKRWSRIDTADIEISVLSDSESVSWLNINRRGGVAYVKVTEKVLHIPPEEPKGYANVVAAMDCVIEEIMVDEGYALVKKGESVKTGDVLISGVIPTELGGGFCYASGKVIGKYSETVSVSVPFEIQSKIYGEDELYECGINFFGFYLNIFKKYRQPQSEYDIINQTEDVTVYKKLPISVTKIYHRPYIFEKKRLSEDEVIDMASDKLKAEMLSFLADKEALRMQTGGGFCEDGYNMYCYTLVSGDVAKIMEFKLEQEK